MKVHLFKKQKRATFWVAVVILVLVAFFTFIFQAHFLSNETGLKKGEYFKVLSGIDNIEIKNPKIKDIAFLGSHDSFSNEVSYSSVIDPAEKGFLGNQAISKLIRGFTVRYAVAQEVGAKEQLSLGVRYFDVRSSFCGKEWETKHGLISGKLDEYLKDILTFLNENNGEVLILDFQHIYYGDKSVDFFFKHLDSIKVNEKSLFDYVNYTTLDGGVKIEDLTYNEVTNSKTQSGVVMLFNCEDYDFEFSDIESIFKNKFYDREKDVRSLWHSTSNEKKILSEIEKEANFLSGNKDFENKLRINQTQQSFSAGSIFSSLFKWSLLDIADDYNVKLVNSNNFNKWLKVMPIFMVDFATSKKGDFNKLVNEKIFNYNVELCK